jgi:Fe-S-cluster containining protein
MPDLPNFLVGRILADAEIPHGRASTEQRIEQRIGVTPWGLRAPPAYKLLHEKSVNAVGRMTSLRCPHFVTEDGTCGIHRHRNHLCSTWFCKHERGRIGYTFWQALKQLIKSIEEELARWCALELGLSPAALSMLEAKSEDAPTDATEIEGNLSEPVYQAFWGNWAGREYAFYLECGQRTDSLDSEGLLNICGPATRVHLEVTRAAWAQLMSTELPATLRCGTYQLLGVREEGVSAITYASTDPIGIPAPVLSVLHLFDGRPTPEILQQLVDERGLQLHEDLLRQLVDWGVLS